MIDGKTTSAGRETAVLVLAHDGEILKASAQAAGLLCAEIGKIEGLNLSAFLADKSAATTILERLVSEETPGGITVKLSTADSQVIDVTLSGLALPCSCSDRLRIVCAMQTATRPPDLADLLPDIVFEMDVSGTLTFVNQKAYEITGYTREDFEKGMRALDILIPEDRDRAARNIREILAGAGEEPNEYTALRADGTRFPVMIHSVPAYCDGKPAGLRGIMIDITEQRRAETDLRIVDSAMASSINAIAIADMEGRLTYVNAAFLRLWGYESQEEVMRRPVVEFWLMSEKAVEVVKALHRDGGWIGELVGKRKDGSVFDVETAATLVIDDAGTPIRMMASFIDITDRKRTELERQQDLMRREKLHGVLEMAGATCHEFNQPMQVISGYTELLLRDSKESGLGTEELKRIKAASDRMIEITRKLHQITRYETREYVGGATIIDIDKSSCLTAPKKPSE
jgi:PAS domain S-box-containing protein